jgi:hypothetical protein
MSPDAPTSLRKGGWRFPGLSTALILAGLGAPWAAFRFFDPARQEDVPRLLSQTGVYSDIVRKVADTALIPFEINAPLWSDGASKQRWIILPPGRHVPYADGADLFDFPDSTVFVKNFLLHRVEGDSSTRVYWETRLLMNRKDAEGANVWRGFSYRWNGDASEAALVSPDSGFDTSFYYHPRGASGPQSYKKWHFPSQGECNTCHGARHVLGFLPAQLKRPAPGRPGINQVLELFGKGVFAGTPPADSQLSARWKGLHESIPAGLSPQARFAVIDTMARSYLAANCSGCHGERGIARRMAPEHVNYDFFRLRPAIEFAHVPTNTSLLDTEYTDSEGLFGRRYLREALVQAGVDTASGSVWDLAKPEPSRPPALVYPGFPAYSTIIYRQIVRRAPWRDSAEMRMYLRLGEDPDGWLPWIFSQPWGSEAWRQELASHGLAPRRTVSYSEEVASGAGGQMPPLNTSFLVDADAVRLLGEWVKNYRTLQEPYLNVDPGRDKPSGSSPALRPTVQGRFLLIPGAEGAPGRNVQMYDAYGHRYRLGLAGAGRFRLPEGLSEGVYFFRAGPHRFKILLSP